MALEDTIIKVAIDRSKLEGASREKLPDGKGLNLIVYPPSRKEPKGAAVWWLRYRSPEDGKQRELELGRYPAMSLASARKAAAEQRTELGRGVDPILTLQRQVAAVKAEQEAQRAAAELEAKRLKLEAERLDTRMTVISLFEQWQKAELGRRKDKGAEVLRAFSKDVFPAIGHLALEDVRRRQVMELLDAITARGADRLANRNLSDLRQMFGYALIREYMEIDPTARIKKADVGGAEEERDRILSHDEIKLLPALVPAEGLNNIAGAARLELPTQCAIWLMLSTLARVGEVVRARWEDVDFDRKEWRIPAEHSKNGKPHLIHLSDFALRQFERLRGQRRYAKSGTLFVLDPVWIFPGTRNKGHVCIKTIQKQIKDRQRATAMCNRSLTFNVLALPGGDWTAHDLRRTGATLLGDLGVRGDVIEKCLNHVEEKKVKRTYQRAELLDERRQAFDLLGQRLDLLTREHVENVLILKRA